MGEITPTDVMASAQTSPGEKSNQQRSSAAVGLFRLERILVKTEALHHNVKQGWQFMKTVPSPSLFWFLDQTIELFKAVFSDAR